MHTSCIICPENSFCTFKGWQFYFQRSFTNMHYRDKHSYFDCFTIMRTYNNKNVIMIISGLDQPCIVFISCDHPDVCIFFFIKNQARIRLVTCMSGSTILTTKKTRFSVALTAFLLFFFLHGLETYLVALWWKTSDQVWACLGLINRWYISKLKRFISLSLSFKKYRVILYKFST